MSIIDMLGRGGAKLQHAMESLVSKSLAMPAQSGRLAGRLPNLFELSVPRKLEQRVGMDVICSLCGKVIMSHVPDGRVAQRFVLLAHADSSFHGGEMLLQVKTLSDDELRASVAREYSRIASGLTMISLYPAHVLVISAGGELREFDRSFSFGRADGNDVVIPMPAVSARHGQVVCDGTSWELIDLSSSNGTELNGRTIKRATLGVNDKVSVAGRVAFEVTALRPWLVTDDGAGKSGMDESVGCETVDEHAPTHKLTPEQRAAGGDTVERPYVVD